MTQYVKGKTKTVHLSNEVIRKMKAWSVLEGMTIAELVERELSLSLESDRAKKIIQEAWKS